MKLGTLIRIANINETEKKFRDARELGFTSCQLVYKPEKYVLDDAKYIRKMAHQEGIEISAQFCGYYDNDTIWDNYYGYLTSGLNADAYRTSRLNYLRQAVPFVQALGISDMVVHAGFIPNNPFSTEYASMKMTIELLARECEKHQVNILFETGPESPVVLLRLIKDIGRENLYINLDPANLLMYGYGNPVDAVATFGKYVRNVHGKDGMPPTDPVVLGKETPVGEGRVDFYAMFRALKALGYDRFITIEREIVGEKQTEDILKAKRYFEIMLQEVYGE